MENIIDIIQFIYIIVGFIFAIKIGITYLKNSHDGNIHFFGFTYDIGLFIAFGGWIIYLLLFTIFWLPIVFYRKFICIGKS